MSIFNAFFKNVYKSLSLACSSSLPLGFFIAPGIVLRMVQKKLLVDYFVHSSDVSFFVWVVFLIVGYHLFKDAFRSILAKEKFPHFSFKFINSYSIVLFLCYLLSIVLKEFTCFTKFFDPFLLQDLVWFLILHSVTSVLISLFFFPFLFIYFLRVSIN
jgi:hypothetical protein